jgi:hypothetical protein
MIRIVGAGTTALRCTVTGEFMNSREASGRDELEQAGRPKTREFAVALTKAMKIGTFTGPRRTSRVDQGSCSSVQY